MTGFLDRASVFLPDRHGGGLCYPKRFPRLQWQLTLIRINRRHNAWRVRIIRNIGRGMDPNAFGH